jgi:transglutaminase/protease-like cytokinesis protein 3
MIAVVTCFALLVGSVDLGNYDAEAKVTYIKSLKIASGNSYTLTIKGKKGKVKWSTSKKSVASINSKGKVTAKKKGKCTISGKISGKTYKTSVTVYSSSGSVKLTNTAAGGDGSTSISGSMSATLSKVGTAIANRYTTINVTINSAVSASSYTSKLFSATAGYVNDYDYLSMSSYAYSAVSNGSTTTIKYTIKYRVTSSYNKKFLAKAKSVAKKFTGSTSSKIKKIHDYIVKNTEYVNGGYTAYNALIDHGAVCEGYALEFYILCKYAGLSCRVVTGTAYGSNGEGNHAWNVVKNGSKWYNMDVTWDDTTSSTAYYMKSNSKFSKHYADSRSQGFLSGLNRA